MSIELIYKYLNTKSRLNEQLYKRHDWEGRVYLTPIDGKTKKQLRMPFTVFMKAIQDGYYKPQ